MPAAASERDGRRRIGFFDEAGQRIHPGRLRQLGADLDIAVCRLRPMRLHAESDELAGACGHHREVERVVQRVRQLDRRVGRHHPQHAVGRGGEQGGGGDRRGGVPSDGLQHDGRIGDADVTELLGDQEAVLVVADRHEPAETRAHAAQRRFLQHGPLRHQGPELLWEALPRHRPQPRARPARQDHRDDRAGVRGSNLACHSMVPSIYPAPNRCGRMARPATARQPRPGSHGPAATATSLTTGARAGLAAAGLPSAAGLRMIRGDESPATKEGAVVSTLHDDNAVATFCSAAAPGMVA